MASFCIFSLVPRALIISIISPKLQMINYLVKND